MFLHADRMLQYLSQTETVSPSKRPFPIQQLITPSNILKFPS